MVGMDSTFGCADITTPHGGAPFQGWRKGFGFGKSSGPGSTNPMENAAMPMMLRFTPKGDRGLASNPFWRTKYEVGQANSFGIGPRPDYGNAREANIGPNTYGDISKQVGKVQKTSTRKGITLKPRFDAPEEKKIGPGPSRNTVPPFGTDAPAFSLRCKPILQGDLREAIGKPGPGGYNTACTAGKNYPIKHGTLHDISIKYRTKIPEMGAVSPGPSKYQIKGDMDQYNLWTKISNVKPPKHGYWRSTLPDTHPMRTQTGIPEEVASTAGSFDRMQEDSLDSLDREHTGRGLTRVESSPV